MRWSTLPAAFLVVLAPACSELRRSVADTARAPSATNTVESAPASSGPASSSVESAGAPSSAAAGSASASSAPSNTRATAIATFLRAWADVMPRLDANREAWARNVDRLVRSAKPPLEVRTEACRVRRAFIEKNIPEISKLTLFGDLAALARDGDCQIVFVAGGMKQEAEFVLDGRASVVLFAWIVPEG